jgi:hypothetical protein
MWDVVKGTPQQGYVANPHTPPGSIHNPGCAVDLSVWDTSTRAAVDMGSPYDFFGARAHPAKEVELSGRELDVDDAHPAVPSASASPSTPSSTAARRSRPSATSTCARAAASLTTSRPCSRGLASAKT